MKVLAVSEILEDLTLLKRILPGLHKGLEVVTASNQDDAINTVSSDGPFAFFIIDAEMKDTNPNQISKVLIDLAGDRPILFMGHELVITDRIEKIVFQANDKNEKLLKPLNRQNLKDDLQKVSTQAITWAAEDDFTSALEDVDPSEFVKMKLKSFYLYQVFPYDIYLEMAPTRYMKIIYSNKPYTISTLELYAKKNVKHLYIKKDDQIKYLEEEIKKCLKGMRKISPESPDIFIILLRSVTIMHQYMLTLGVTPAVLALTTGLADSIISVVHKNQLLTDCLKSYPTKYEGIASKSLLTSLLSIYICNEMEWDSVTTKKKLILASLLQDYLLQEDSMSKLNSLSDPAFINYSDELVKLFFNHPKKVAEVSAQFTIFPEINFILENHHETPSRNGFPNRPALSKLTALNGVFNISQYVAAQIDGVDYSPESYLKVLKVMSKDYNHGNFKVPFKTLNKLLSSKD